MNIIRLLPLLLILLIFSNQIYAQGCVAIQGMGCSNTNLGSINSSISSKGSWIVSTDYRYFRSFRHFRGDHEEEHRLKENTEVINRSHILDFGIGYGLTDRLLISVNIPLLKNHRSSLYEHYGNSLESNPEQQRFSTSSSGLGDIRLTALYWAKDPLYAPKNIALGIGVKAPTGNPHVMGTFYKLDGNGSQYTIEKPVDQSIQLGDGGWGIIIQSRGYMKVLSDRAALFYNGFYMMNTQERNQKLRSPNRDPNDPWSYFASPDQFGMRYGLNYFLSSNFSVGLGNLIEGVPAQNLISGSDAYRRPGYVVSVEPAVGFMKGSLNFNLSVPIAVYRNRVKSTWDKKNDRHGDAAFADYLVNLNVNYRFGQLLHKEEKKPSSIGN